VGEYDNTQWQGQSDNLEVPSQGPTRYVTSTPLLNFQFPNSPRSNSRTRYLPLPHRSRAPKLTTPSIEHGPAKSPAAPPPQTLHASPICSATNPPFMAWARPSTRARCRAAIALATRALRGATIWWSICGIITTWIFQRGGRGRGVHFHLGGPRGFRVGEVVIL
jgi:hypothetical protein